MYCTVKIDARGGMDKAIQAAVSGLLDRIAWDDEPFLTDDYEITVHLNVLEGSVTAARRDLHE